MKILIFIFGIALAATQEDNSPLWPKDFKLDNNQQITMYQPQVTTLDGDKVAARAAFRILENKKEVYGSFIMNGRSFVSKDDGLVTIQNIQVSDLQFPGGKTSEKALQTSLQNFFGNQKIEVSYQSLVNSRDMQIVESERPQLKNTPPKFVFTKRPSILIMISGDPVWAPQKGASEVERVSNTSALILHQKNKEYYIWALNKWFAAKNLNGPYSVSKDVSSKFVIIKDDLIKNKKVDPLEGKSPEGQQMFAPNETPLIIISTVPAELLQSSGEPEFQAVEGTGLLYMSNSPNSIFVDAKTQDYFVLVTGRWFKSKSLEGPWEYVSGTALPSDFKKIPATSPVAEVLVSVPGTSQAKEGVIVSSIPQMAQVKKDLKPQNIECDGTRAWQSIEGTNLSYATNCNTPIIKVTPSQFYTIQDGVWFVSNDGNAWNVAVAVPAQIYKIPASCPIYYVTYVHVYSVSGDYVTVGYTPGYHGTFVSADGTVVYGTGYVYPAYATTTVWYPAPATYGFGAGYGWGYSTGFFMGFAVGSFMYPWGWGGCCWHGSYINVTNVYHNWGTHSVIAGPGGHRVLVNTLPGGSSFYRGGGSRSIYTTHDGQVYRRTGAGSWERNVGPGTWTPVTQKNVSSLESLHQERLNGERRFQGMPSHGANEFRGGVLHGGGGMHAGGFHGGGFRR